MSLRGCSTPDRSFLQMLEKVSCTSLGVPNIDP